MSWLVLVFALELGILPQTGFVMYQPNPAYVVDQVGFYTDLSATVEAYGFYAGGGMRCYFWIDRDTVSFWPEQMTFLFEAGWRTEGLNVGFRHYCMHPVVPYLALTGAPPQNWEGSYEEIYIRFDGRVPLGRRQRP